MERRQFPDVFPLLGVYSDTAFNPASLIDAAGETKTVAAPGVKLGLDSVVSFVAGVDLAGITVSAYVSADDVISVRLQNESGGTVDLAVSTWRFVVGRVKVR